MIHNHYDVVTLGTSIEALTASALLAKRGYRVMVLGHEKEVHEDEIDDFVLPRRPSVFVPAASGIVNRTMRELSLQDHFRRAAFLPEPRFQLALEGVRADVAKESQQRYAEYGRAFPDGRRALSETDRYAVELFGELDGFLEQDLVWPPTSLSERREFARAMTQHSFGRDGSGPDPLASLRTGSPARHLVELPVSFSSHLAQEQASAFSRARLFGLWLAGAAHIRGGEKELSELLLSKLVTYGGAVRKDERVDRIRVKRGQLTGVRIRATEEELGASFLLFGQDIRHLSQLIEDRRPLTDYFDRYGEPQIRYHRYVLNLVVTPEGIPPGMGPELFFVGRADRPTHGDNVLRIHRQPKPVGQDHEQLTVEALLPFRKPKDQTEALSGMRERVLGSVKTLLPFLEPHLRLVDSPSDGRDAQNPKDGTLCPSPVPWTRGPASMDAVYRLSARGPLGVVGLPSRLPIRGLLLVNRQVVPGLGLEGQILSARTAARLVVQGDTRKQWMRGRALWKAEM